MIQSGLHSKRPPTPKPAVAVVGTGAVGSELCRLLAHAGFARVLLIDPDTVQPRNLQCSPFLQQAFTHAGEPDGAYKVDLLAGEAARSFGLQWDHGPVEIADAGLGELQTYDVLCCCTDSALSRAETALAARLLAMPMLDCGVFGDGIDEGRVTCFGRDVQAACSLCGVGEQARARLLAYAASASLGCAPPAADVPMTGTSAAVAHTAARAVEILSQAALPGWSSTEKMRLGADGCWNSVYVRHGRSETCPWHDFVPGELCALDWSRSFRSSLLERAGTNQPVIRLHWPVCLEAVCRICGTTSQPMRRVAWVRRRQRCVGCGQTGTAEPLRCVHTVAADDEIARATPRQLHLSASGLYTVARAFTVQSTSPGEYV